MQSPDFSTIWKDIVSIKSIDIAILIICFYEMRLPNIPRCILRFGPRARETVRGSYGDTPSNHRTKGVTSMKFHSKLVVATLAGVLMAGAAAQAQEMTFFRIGTGGAGGTYFPIGGLIANAISNPPGSGKTCEQGGSCGVPGLIAIAQIDQCVGPQRHRDQFRPDGSRPHRCGNALFRLSRYGQVRGQGEAKHSHYRQAVSRRHALGDEEGHENKLASGFERQASRHCPGRFRHPDRRRDDSRATWRQP